MRFGLDRYTATITYVVSDAPINVSVRHGKQCGLTVTGGIYGSGRLDALLRDSGISATFAAL